MWRYIWLLPIYLLSSSLPLVFSSGLNLEYEYLFLSGVFLVLLLPLLAYCIPFYLIPVSMERYSPIIKQELFVILSSILVALIPAFFIFSVGACKCSFNGFIFWGVIQWFPSWMLAHVLYENILRMRVKYHYTGKSSLRIIIYHYAFIFLYVVATIFCIWFFPQKRISTYLLGFIHGAIYDSGIYVDTSIFLRQLSYILLSFFFLGLIWYKREDFFQKFLSGLFGVLFIILYSYSWFLPSTSIGSWGLKNKMPYSIESSDFIVHYSDSNSEINSLGLVKPNSYIKKMMIEIKFHVDELKQILKQNSIKKIHVYIYPDKKSKKLWLGGGSTDITDVTTPSIHIVSSPDSDYHTTLRHELVHAIASNFSPWGLGFNPNMVFTEGLAMALAPSFSDVSFKDITASVVNDKGFNIKKLFSPFFWKESSTKSYVVADSFISYIIENYGVDKIKALYSGKSWNKVFNKDKNKVIENWKRYVLEGFDADKYKLIVDNLLKYKGVLNEKCPHTRFDYNLDSNDIFVKLRQPISWDRKNYWDWRIGLDPNDLYSKYNDLRLKASFINKGVFIDITKNEQLLSEIEKIENEGTNKKSIENIEILLLKSDVLRIMNRKDDSIKILSSLHEEYSNSSEKFPPFLVRSILSRIYIENTKVAEEEKIKWRKFLASWTKLPEYNLKEDWIFSYLRLRNSNNKFFTRDILNLFLLKALPLDLYPSFYEEWYRILGIKFMNSKLYEKAEFCYEKASTYTDNDTSKLFYSEHKRRVSYYINNKNMVQ